MTAAAYSTNLSDIFTSGTTTGWSALGGGASGLNQETDYFIQGTSCMSKNAFASDEKGMIYSYGSDAGGSGTDGAYLFWLTHLTPNSLAAKASGGIQALIGSASGAYEQYYVGGSDTIEFGGWILAAVNEATAGDNTTGTPSTTVESYFGAMFNLPTGGPTKGAPNAVDAIRFGRCDAVVEHGTTPDADAEFDGIVSNLDSVTNRYGLLSFLNGVYYNSGLLLFGTATNACEFTDSNKTILLRDHDHVTTNFHTWEVRNASSVINLTNVTVQALGNTSRGRWVTTDNADINITACSFTDMGTFQFDTNSLVHETTFRRCDAVSPQGGGLTHCTIEDTNVAANNSAMIWDETSDPNTSIENMAFKMGSTATHAIEFGLNSPTTITLRGIDFTDYGTGNNANDSVLHIKRTSGTVTINVIGGSGTVSYRTDGATVVVQNSVVLTVNVQDEAKVAIQNAQTSIHLLAAPHTELMNEDTTALGVATESYNYPGTEQEVVIKVRKSEDLDNPRYKAYSDTATINANGLTRTVTLREQPLPI